jgi:hypothetical protein
MEEFVIILALHIFVIVEQAVNLPVQTAKQRLHQYQLVRISSFFEIKYRLFFFLEDCPLDCGSGTCVKSGGQQVAYACMCNGTLSPTRC